MALMARGRIPADPAVPVRSLDPDRVLDQLPQGWAAPRGARSGARHAA